MFPPRSADEGEHPECRGTEHDFAIEADAALRFDSREALPRIRVPVLLVNGDRDRYSPKELVEQTAQLIPDCTLVWYPGKGHDDVCRNSRLGSVILRLHQPAIGTHRHAMTTTRLRGHRGNARSSRE